MTPFRLKHRAPLATILVFAIPAALFSVGLVYAAGAQTIFVSMKGNDSANGSKATPVHSVARAIALARTQRRHGIEIEGGAYRLESPLALTPADSGLSLRAAPGQQVTLSGGRRIEGWKLIDAKRSLWSAHCPAGYRSRGRFMWTAFAQIVPVENFPYR